MVSKVEDLGSLLKTVLCLLDVAAEVTVSEGDSGLLVDLSGDDLSVLIGGQGKTLNALQALLNAALNREEEGGWQRVVLDAEGYRERRRESLEEDAQKTAAQAVEEDREISLEPMNAYERRIVHCALADREDVKTDSRGEEPYRFIVISPAGKLPD